MFPKNKRRSGSGTSTLVLWVAVSISFLCTIYVNRKIESLMIFFKRYSIIETTDPSLSSENQPLSHTDQPNHADPCFGRPTPQPLQSNHVPPTLYFLHLPKTAGSTTLSVLRSYANRTMGVGCVYLRNSDDYPAHSFHSDGVRIHEQIYASLGSDSISYKMAHAMRTLNSSEKFRLFQLGGCRSVRGHATLSRLKYIRAPVFLFTILREPLERFISMYDFGTKTQKSSSAWAPWMHHSSLSEELDDPKSILHLPFYDDSGRWALYRGQFISFTFYGVLNQLSGVRPQFTGAGDIQKFSMTNDRGMAEVAKDNLCRMHLIGYQENATFAFEGIVNATHRWANYSDLYRKRVLDMYTNLTPNKTSRNPLDLLRPDQVELLKKRLFQELEVYHFSKRITDYRNSIFDPRVNPNS